MVEPAASTLAAAEVLARFVVYQKREVRPSDSTPKPDLFMPDEQHTCSTYRLNGLQTDGALKAVSDDVGLKRRGKPAYGYCPITVGAVKSCGMSVDPDDVPKHHANIKGYPPLATPDLIKARALALSQVAGKMVDAYLKPADEKKGAA
jgi:hypothetical protein